MPANAPPETPPNALPPTMLPSGRGGPGKKRRPGGGRKAKTDPAFTHPVSTRLTDSDGQSLAAWAALEGVTEAELARRAIEDFLRQRQFA